MSKRRVTPTKDRLHIVPHEGGWAIKREGGVRASGNFATKEEALEEGRYRVQQGGVELVIHNEDGTIENSDESARDESTIAA